MSSIQTDNIDSQLEIDVLISDKPNVELPEMNDRQKKIINQIRSQWQDFRDWFESNHKERIRENYRRYNAMVGEYEDPDDQWRGVDGHPIRLALEYAVVETYKTRITKSLIGGHDLAKIKPKKPSTIKNAELMDKCVKFFKNEDKFDDKLIDFIDQLCKNGACPWFMSQEQKKALKIEETQTVTPAITSGGFEIQPEQIQVEKRAVEYFIENKPTLNIYDIENVGFNYTLGKYEDSPWFVFRDLIHRATLAKMFPQYRDLFNSGLLDWNGMYDFNDERAGEIGLSNQRNNTWRLGRIEVYVYSEANATIIVFGDKFMVEFPNQTQGKKEVFTGMGNILPQFKEPYGKDLIQLSKTYADLWNELINNEVDSIKLKSSLTVKIKKNAGVEMDTIYNSPGAQWVMEDMDSVQEVNYSWQSGSSFGLLQLVGQKDQQIHGASDAVQGTPTSAQFSRDIQRMQEESNNKFWMVLTNIKRELVKIHRAYVRHIQEYVAPTLSQGNPLTFLITGDKDFDQVEINNPMDLMGDFDYEISLEIEDVDKNLIRAQLIQAIQIVMRNPQLSQTIPDPGTLVKVLFKTFPNIRELEGLTGGVEGQLNTILSKLSSEQLSMVLGQLGQMIDFKKQQEMQSQIGKSGAGKVPAGGRANIPTNNKQIHSGFAKEVPSSLPNVSGGNPNRGGAMF